ncbi:hypothetical protein LTR27_011588 [Elasticomyces elasticus]|nr:hypothetical protein LTR27_011588 [Elasticomyces elasticus]
MASLPTGRYGTNAIATISQGLRSSLPHVRAGLLVGIGAGKQSDGYFAGNACDIISRALNAIELRLLAIACRLEEIGRDVSQSGENSSHDGKIELRRQIQLGDVVVSVPQGTIGGVVQVDLVKAQMIGGNERLLRTGSLDGTPEAMLTALSKLQAQHELEDSQLYGYVDQAFKVYPKMSVKYGRPDLPDIYHTQEGAEIVQVPRKPQIHYGTIASGNTLVKSALHRAGLLERLSLEGIEPICIEMEAAGLMNNFPCLVIRGICDYADQHKNDDWQKYAAMTAAAFAKEFLGCVDPVDIRRGRNIEDLVKQVDARVERVEAAMEKGQQSKETDAMLDWISEYDYWVEQNEKIQQGQPGTGRWLLEHETILAWISGNVKTVLCKGAPGAGKSVMASLIVRRLQNELHDRSRAVVRLYCDYGRQTLQTSMHFLSSTLRQLLARMGKVPDEVIDWYNKHAGHDTKPTAPVEAEVKNMLRVVEKNFTVVHVVIDALDEASFHDVARLLDCREGLPGFEKMRLLVTSRWHQEIALLLPSCHTMEIRAAGDDVEAYMQNHRDRLPRFVQRDEELITRMFAAIRKAANGIFLLARLHLASFNGHTNMQRVEDTLQHLPTGIDAYQKTYDAAMGRINAQLGDEPELAKNVLQWIHSAKRPLRVSELQHALAVREKQTSPDLRFLPDIDIMLSVCAGLVEAVEQQANSAELHVVQGLKDSRVVRFVHYTIEEYFKDTAIRWFPDKDRICTVMCHVYLSYLSGPCATDEDMLERFRVYAWYRYAVLYWRDHFREAETLTVDAALSPTDAALAFLQESDSVACAVQAASVQSTGTLGGDKQIAQGYRKLVTGLHLVAQLGLSSLTQQLLLHQGKATLNTRDDAGPWGATPLYRAVAGGHEDTVAILLDWGADVNAHCGEGGSALYAANLGGHEKIAQMLLRKGAELDAYGDAHNISLQWACWRGNETTVLRLLREGSDINALGYSHGSALMAASGSGHETLVRLLLKGGAEVDLRRGDGSTALVSAAIYGNHAIVQLLLEHGADATVVGCGNKSALLYVLERCGRNYGNPSHYAQRWLEMVSATVRLLLDNGVDVNVLDDDNNSALWYVLKCCVSDRHNGFQAAALNSISATMRLLLDKGADVNVLDRDNRSALLYVLEGCGSNYHGGSYAATLSHVSEMVRLLLDKGADVNVVNCDNKSALLYVLEGCASEHKDGSHGAVSAMVRLLIDKGADVNVRNRDGTALGLACTKGDVALVQLLLQKGALVNAQSGPYGTALQGACWRGRESIVRLLLQHGAEVNILGGSLDSALKASSLGGCTTLVQILLDYSADVNLRTAGTKSALAEACGEGHREVACLLLEHGADIHAQDREDTTALHDASRAGHVTTVQLLLERGVNVNLTGRSRTSALVYASQAQSEEAALAVVRLLLDHGAYINAQSSKYGTALCAASLSGHERIVRLLLEDGAYINARDRAYGDAFQAACYRGGETVVRLLLENGACVSIQGGYYGNALCAASRGAHLRAVQLLLDSGADVNTKGGRYGGAIGCILQYRGKRKKDQDQVYQMLREAMSWEEIPRSRKSRASSKCRRRCRVQNHVASPHQVLKRIRNLGPVKGQRRQPGKRRTRNTRRRDTFWRECEVLLSRLIRAFDRALGVNEGDELWGRLWASNSTERMIDMFLEWRHRRL